MTSQHDTESAILDPLLRSLIRDPQVVLHDAAIAVALDLRTVGQRNSGEEVKAVSCNDLHDGEVLYSDISLFYRMTPLLQGGLATLNHLLCISMKTQRSS